MQTHFMYLLFTFFISPISVSAHTRMVMEGQSGSFTQTMDHVIKVLAKARQSR